MISFFLLIVFLILLLNVLVITTTIQIHINKLKYDFNLKR